MIEIIDAYRRSGCEWCACCQKQTNTKRIRFSQDGRQGVSVVLCDDCRKELSKALDQEPVLDKIQTEIEQNAYPIVHGVNNHEKGMTLYGILQILDKIGKAESEDIDPNDLTHMFDGVTDIPKDAFKGWTTEELLEQIRKESEG